ncbi:hypothetical protein GCM10007860_35560 [Chitiniphilus shinanonensis]|uniref:DUF3261 domain-containing protein n=1 Tax=Chitiniphilus shinanonensis TaxID=553088 RepID=A0ABQ6C1J4_9NEIS|nr:hypothetical protein GCM10007860_35560 [Chitiniphilus shinanonensis]
MGFNPARSESTNIQRLTVTRHPATGLFSIRAGTLGGVVVLLAALLLTACAAFAPALWRMPPAALGEHLAQQRLVIERAGQVQALEVVLQSDATAVRLIGDALAVRLFTLDYDGARVVEGPGLGLPAGLPPALIVNDLLAVHAPLPALRAALPAGWQTDEAGGVRTVRDAHGRTMQTITYGDGAPWQGRSELVSAHGYRLTIDSTEAP